MVNLSTRIDFTKLLDKLNKKRDEFGKVEIDMVIRHMLNKITPEDEQAILLATVDWDIEDKRLRRLYEKKFGKVSNKQWIGLGHSGKLSEFIKENSRIPLEEVSA